MMRAVVLDNGIQLRRDHPQPERAADEALVRVRMCGICRTDIELAAGYMDYRGVIGHEFVGEVVEPAEPPLIGRRVVGEINAACGECAMCRRGLPRHCTQRTVLGIAGRHGAFADFLVLPARNLHLVDDDVSDERAVFAEPLAAAFEILEQVPIASSDRVLILGDGKLGLLIALALQRTGCELHLSGRHPERLSRLRPCHATWQGVEDDNPGSFDVVVEATGRSDGFERALSLVRPRGTLVLKTTVADKHAIDFAPAVIDEITIVGSRCGPFRPALRALGSGEIDPTPLIDAVYSLDHAVEAMEHARRPGVLKVLLKNKANSAPRPAPGAEQA